MKGIEAKIRLIPPKERGRSPKIEEVISALRERGIVYGIDEVAIRKAILNKVYHTFIVVARAKRPSKGASASYLYKYKEPIEVIPGQILAIKEPPKRGEPGISVFGTQIPGILGDDFQIIAGKNTELSEDGRLLYATQAGEVAWKENRCDVERVLRINGDLKEDVNFEGKIIVSGSILEGVSIKAEELLVKGNIKQGTNIVLKGSLELEGDIIGEESKRVNIKTGGDCIGNSASYCEITSAGSLIMKTGLLYSHVKTLDCVAIGRKGVIMTSGDVLPPIFSLPIAMERGVKGIIGGRIYAKNSVSAETIGDISQVETEIIVDAGGIVSCSSSLYPKTKITIGKASFEIKNIIETISLKEERQTIVQIPYQPKELRLKAPEKTQKREEVPFSILVDSLEEGKMLLGIENIDFLEIPIQERKAFLCFPSQTEGPWEALRKELDEQRRKKEEKNGEIEVLNQKDGLFVKIIPPGIKGKALTLDEAKERLKDYDYDENILQEALKRQEAKPIRIGGRQYIPELDGRIIIKTNEGKEAYLMATPPNPNLGKRISPRAILRELEKHKIRFGEDKIALRDFIKNPIYHKEILIARCKMPTKGQGASYLYRFEEPIEVIPGQILAIKEPPKRGEPGISIFGEEIPPLLGDDFEIIEGRNTYLSEDKTTLYATKKGRAIWEGNRCDVLKILEIEGSCESDVKFEGRVLVAKDVKEGISIEADEVFIKGNVEKGALIISKGGIEIEGDIIGDEKKRIIIKAEGEVFANSALFSDITAGGSIIMKTGLLHSNTKTEDCVIIGRKGVIIMTSGDVLPPIFSLPIAMAKGISRIVGGRIYAKKSVSSEIIGSISQEKTEIIVEEKGMVSCSGSIYPKTRITIGKAFLEVKKIIEHLTLREEKGVIISSPYQQKEVKRRYREEKPKKPETPPSILVKDIESGKKFLKREDIDFLKIPLDNKSLFLCFPRERHPEWEALRKELDERRRKEEERNGEIEILNQEDGLFVIIKPPGIRGNPVSLLEAKERLKEYYDYDEKILEEAVVKQEAKPVRIGERQYIEELDGKITIRIEEDKKAYLMATPPNPHLGRPIRPRIIIKELEKNNIKFGIDKIKIANFLKRPIYGKEILIASYKEPTKGEDAKLIYQFGIQEGKELKKEDTLEVIEGQILAIKEPPKIGEPGISIFGEEIPGRLGEDFELIPGMNTYLSPDGRILYAQEKGEASWKGLRCDVEKVLRIETDCNEDINFPGKVIVSGDVKKRTTIMAKGDIVVKGVVEMGARLISEQSIYVDKSLMGKKGEEIFLKAGMDVICESCERADIEAGGILLVRVFLDGNVKAKRVFIQGRRGIIMTKGEVPPPIFTLPVVIAKGKKTFEGGKIIASELVDSEEMGSAEMAETEVELGEGGKLSISGTIFPNAKIKIGRTSLRITKPLIGLTFKLKEGRIKEFPYESTPIELTKKEFLVRKRMKIEPPASIVITNQNLLDAIASGARLLKLKEEQVEFSLLLEEKPNKTIRVYPSLMFGPWSEDWEATYGEDRDGSFTFDNRADGLYLIIHPPYGEGKMVAYEDVLRSIEKEGFTEIDKDAIKGLFKDIEEKKEKKERSIRIGKRQYLSDVSTIIKLRITEDERCEAIFYPPVIGGMFIDIVEVMKYLDKEGIKEGIDQRAIKEALIEGKFKEPIVIASPIPPIPGSDARLEYKVKPKEGIVFKEIDGRVDFKETSSIVSVKKGDVLVIKHPARPGVPGKKITGEEIPPPPVKDIPLPLGKNTKISEDGLSLIADIDGMVIFKKERIDIEPLYEIKGDVCLLTGNIHFPGKVIVSGSVQEGFLVEAEGDVLIKGGIEGGIIKTKGRIEVREGIRRGRVEGKDIYCAFVENAYLSGDSIEVEDAVLHSIVLSNRIKAKRIMGGRIFAEEKIESDEIGGRACKTSLYLGRKKEAMVEIESLTKTLKEEKALFERLLLDINYGNMLSSNRKELLKEKLERKKEKIERMIKSLKELENMEINKNAACLVKNRVYPGTEISILSGHFLVLEEKEGCSFKLEKGRVVMGNL